MTSHHLERSGRHLSLASLSALVCVSLCYSRKTAKENTHESDHNYILAEFVPLAQIRGLPRLLTLELSQNLLTDDSVEVVWVDDQLHGQALELLHTRNDKTYSLCDAVSFLLMRDRDISDALTTDKHFEQEGFVRLLK